MAKDGRSNAPQFTDGMPGKGPGFHDYPGEHGLIARGISVKNNVREIPKGSKVDGGYSGWYNWDTWEATLFIDNEETSYNKKVAWAKNFAKRIRNGTFDRAEARKAMMKYLFPEAVRQEKSILGKEYYAADAQKITKSRVNADELVDWVVMQAADQGDLTPAEATEIAGEGR